MDKYPNIPISKDRYPNIPIQLFNHFNYLGSREGTDIPISQICQGYPNIPISRAQYPKFTAKMTNIPISQFVLDTPVNGFQNFWSLPLLPELGALFCRGPRPWIRPWNTSTRKGMMPWGAITREHRTGKVATLWFWVNGGTELLAEHQFLGFDAGPGICSDSLSPKENTSKVNSTSHKAPRRKTSSPRESKGENRNLLALDPCQ